MKSLLLVGADSCHLWRFCRMVRDQFETVVVVTNGPWGAGGSCATETVTADFSVRNPLSFLKTVGAIRQVYKKYRPDIVHIMQANTTATSAILALGRYKVPKVLTALGSDILSTPEQGLFYRQMVRYNICRADICTSDSLHMAQAMEVLAGSKRLKIVIANLGIGVEPNRGTPKENLIYSNRMHGKLYRIDKVIEHFAEFMNTAKEDWRLVIAGQGPETGNLKQQVQDLDLQDRVDFVGLLGSRENAAYYNRARIFISLPRSDATSVSLLEAMACGCLPVVSDLPANREWISDGVNGKVVSDGESGVIDQALSIDPVAAANINREIIGRKATVGVSRGIFAGIYAELLEAGRAG
ncbi:MAG: glycosyltransferase [Candidatus Edwardsbacteria bacterium]|nr:glycosyltransferase [Candidatus Edwardsbacteria bacterium]